VWDRWRLIVRRTLNESDQPRLLDDWRHHAFVTSRPGAPVELDADHRAHAVVELAIRDLKHGAGMNRMPSGHFQGNAAWVVACSLAHNLVRWTQLRTSSAGDALRTSPTFRRSDVPTADAPPARTPRDVRSTSDVAAADPLARDHADQLRHPGPRSPQNKNDGFRLSTPSTVARRRQRLLRRSSAPATGRTR
jgi:hypothetical protein